MDPALWCIDLNQGNVEGVFASRIRKYQPLLRPHPSTRIQRLITLSACACVGGRRLGLPKAVPVVSPKKHSFANISLLSVRTCERNIQRLLRPWLFSRLRSPMIGHH
jgi:hypothetical protein